MPEPTEGWLGVGMQWPYVPAISLAEHERRMAREPERWLEQVVEAGHDNDALYNIFLPLFDHSTGTITSVSAARLAQELVAAAVEKERTRCLAHVNDLMELTDGYTAEVVLGVVHDIESGAEHE